MCYQCHMPPEQALKYYQKTIVDSNYKFHKYNTTSVHFLMISMSGHDKLPECRDLAMTIYKEFIKWYKANKEENYFPDTGLEQMYSTGCLERILKIFQDNSDMEEEDVMKLVYAEMKLEKETVPQVNVMDYIKEYNAKVRSRSYYIVCATGLAFGIAIGCGILKCIF